MALDNSTLDGLWLLAQAAEAPQIDGPFIIRVVSRLLHILCAIIIGGGLFYMRTILSPAGADACFAGRRQTWARWVGIATGILLVSGLYNFVVINGEYKAAGTKLPPTYHMLFGIKALLSLAVMAIAALLAGKTDAAERFRANMGRWLNVGWMSVMAIVIIGAMLRAHHVRTPQPAGAPADQAVEASNG